MLVNDYVVPKNVKVDPLIDNKETVKLYIKDGFDYLDSERIEKIKSLVISNPKAILNKKEYPEVVSISEGGSFGRDERMSFENSLVDQAGKKLGNIIVYTGFGSGKLFPDFRILLTLLQRGKKIAAIHLVDEAYRPIIEKLKQEKAIGKTMVAPEMAPFLQFIGILSQVANNRINIYLHGKIGSYFLFCYKNNNLKANLATEIAFDAGPILDKYKELGFSIGALLGQLYTKNIYGYKQTNSEKVPVLKDLKTIRQILQLQLSWKLVEKRR